MPRKKDRHATVLKRLHDVIEHSNPDVVAERRLAIERWVKAYIRQVESLEGDKLQFLYNIFRDESCWSGAKLNNTSLGQRLTEESINGIENPFSRYNMACRYCVVDKIHPLFQEQFESYKGRVSPGAVDIDGNPVDDKYIRNDLLDSMGSYDPAFSFWIDRESGALKEYSNVDGFREVVDLKWSEGVEYFYNRLNLQEREKEIINAVTTLSTIQCNHNRATVLDFCLCEMDGPTKRELLLKLSEKDQGVYSLLNDDYQLSYGMGKKKPLAVIRCMVPSLIDCILSEKPTVKNFLNNMQRQIDARLRNNNADNAIDFNEEEYQNFQREVIDQWKQSLCEKVEQFISHHMSSILSENYSCVVQKAKEISQSEEQSSIYSDAHYKKEVSSHSDNTPMTMLQIFGNVQKSVSNRKKSNKLI